MALGQFIDHDLDHVPMESKFLISIMPNEALWHTYSKVGNRHTPPLISLYKSASIKKPLQNDVEILSCLDITI